MLVSLLMFFLIYLFVSCLVSKKTPQADDLVTAGLVTVLYAILCSFFGIDP